MSTSQDRALQLEDRMMTFALHVIEFSRSAPKDPENKVMISQLLRSATSIGANCSEANNAASRQDFRNKIFIAKKEAAETRYWLRLIQKANSHLSVALLIPGIIRTVNDSAKNRLDSEKWQMIH